MLILITGASSGFGKLTVPLLLEKGHTVIAGLRGKGQGGSDDRLREVFGDELARFPGRLHAVDLHLEQPASFAQAARLLDERFGGKLDILINNAGYGLMGIIEDQSEAQIRQQIEVNYLGPVLLTRALLPALRKARGKILNVSSIAGMSGFPFYASYAASKFALEGFMESLRLDLRSYGVQVGMIEPGGFKTGFVTARQFGEQPAASSPYHERTEAFVRLFDKTSASRLGDPHAVARLIARLCEAKNLRFRNWIGRDARVIRLLRIFLPDRLRLALISWLFELALKSEIRSKAGT